MEIVILQAAAVGHPDIHGGPVPQTVSGNSGAARRYRNLLLDNGFVDVAVEVHTIVWTDATALPVLANIAAEDTWLDDQATRARNDRLFLAVPIFLASGTRAD
ncbi:hypothetical protein [Nocardia sp. CA-135398]|uniref:hypothetical protein n=1 Tax=Nocardia sp. CA-135398 TaxID=3239977 RepID=UPI003D98A6C9